MCHLPVRRLKSAKHTWKIKHGITGSDPIHRFVEGEICAHSNITHIIDPHDTIQLSVQVLTRLLRKRATIIVRRYHPFARRVGILVSTPIAADLSPELS
jgi:hypothetical protein